MYPAIIVFLLLLIAPSVVMAVHFYRRCLVLRSRYDASEEKRREITSFLARFSSGIQGEYGVEGAMHEAARHVAEQTDSESVAIYEYINDELVVTGVCGTFPLVHSTNKLIFTRRHHLFDALRREKITPGEGFLGQIIVSHQGELVPDAAADERFSTYPDVDRFGSVMGIPLLHDGLLVGVAVAVTNRRNPGRSFSHQQFERLNFLSGQILMVQNLVRVYSEISKRDRIDQELHFARQIQLSLLPEAFPNWDPFRIYAFSRSAKEVNGDYYDYVKIDDDRLLIIIGDACGKGIPACMLTAMTRSYARSLSDNFSTLSQFLKDVNSKLYRGTAADRFITLGCCLLDKKNSLVEFGRAGHTDLISFVHGHIRMISPDGVALGILPDEFAEFDTINFAFMPGSTLMLFSDGLTEAVDATGNEFGVTRLSEAFHKYCSQQSSLEDIANQILTNVESFESTQSDDQTIVLISHI